MSRLCMSMIVCMFWYYQPYVPVFVVNRVCARFECMGVALHARGASVRLKCTLQK